MTYQQLSKTDIKILKDGLNSQFWQLIKDYIQDQKQYLKDGILSPYGEEKSKSKRNDRDLMIRELYQREEVEDIPNRLINRISNGANISVEDDH